MGRGKAVCRFSTNKSRPSQTRRVTVAGEGSVAGPSRGGGFPGTLNGVSTPSRVFVAKLAGALVFDPIGDQVGKMRDIVVLLRADRRPRVVGMVIEVPGKRRVFMPMARVTSLDTGQVITTGLVNMRRFEQRTSETLVMADLLERPVRIIDGDEPAVVEDIAMSLRSTGEWEVAKLFVRKGQPRHGLAGRLRRTGETLTLNVEDVSGLSDRPVDGQGAALLVASFEGMKPANIAEQIKDLPPERQREIAAALTDEQLADIVEELGDQDQVTLLKELSHDRAADVLEEMQPDDAADLLSELPEAQQETFLDLMEPEEADDVRRLMAYDDYTAGGLMTTECVILSPEDAIAEGLAMVRRAELSPTIAAAAFITRSPHEPPTGKFLGLVHIQRMLRHAPHKALGSIMDTDIEALSPNAPLSAVTRLLATYNLVSVPVVDEDGCLLGIVTVDDVLDHLLPDDWRDSEDIPTDPVTGEISLSALRSAGRRDTSGDGR